jgi:hypothetical protein
MKGVTVQKFVAVIGNRNSGKSTVIRSLTGCPNSAFRGEVKDITTGESIHVICSSPQESPLTLQELRSILKACAANRKCRGLVMAIQPTSPTKRLSMETIFQEVASLGSFQSHAFMLTPGRVGGSPNTAAIVTRLKPLKLKPITLDGGRFAMLNAQIINKRTHVAG